MNEEQISNYTLCPHCQHYTSRPDLHDCRQIFMGAAADAARNGDQEKVREIIASAAAQGIDLMRMKGN